MEMLGSEGKLPIATQRFRSSSNPADSAAPVTLVTNKLVSSTFRSPTLMFRKRRVFVMAIGAVAAIILLLIATRPPRGNDGARAVAAQPAPAVLAPISVSTPPQELPVVADPGTTGPLISDLEGATGNPEPPGVTPKPKPAGLPMNRPQPGRPRVEVKPPSSPPIPAPTVAPTAEPQVPSNADPLDRRR
jgi:hypothetical protein